MKTTLVALAAIALGTAQAQTYLSCQVQTTFRKPYTHGTEWVHVENKYTKIFKVDAAAKMVSFWDNRNLIWKPVCSTSDSACKVNWADGAISIDGTAQADNPAPPYLDFRRKVTLNGNHVVLLQGDWGQSVGNQPNMTWTYEGDCTPTGVPSMAPFAPPGGRKGNPLYQQASGPAKPVSHAEAAQVLAGYVGNSMTGFSGGGHWFHMWFFKGSPDVIAYTSDDEDISGEGKTRAWWVGKDNIGYRLCPKVDVANNTGKKMVPGENCYPLLVKKVGDVWVEHDMDGDAYFSALAGRQ